MTSSLKEQIAESHSTNLGSMWHGTIESALMQEPLDGLKGKVDLVFTSPPYPLKKKKNTVIRLGDDYLQWLIRYLFMLYIGRYPRLVRVTILTPVTGSSLKMIRLKNVKS
jgi:DNA modification methylase